MCFLLQDGYESPDIGSILDPDLWGILQTANRSDNCVFDVLLPISPSLHRVTVNRMDFYKNIVGHPVNVCTVPNNHLEYIDFSWSPIWELPDSLIGLNALRHFDLRQIQIKSLSVNFFSRMPALEVILLGGNPYVGPVIGSDEKLQMFRTLDRLKILDLSDCNIFRLPRDEFTALTSLVVLNLSGNMLDVRLDLSLRNCSGLQTFDLSRNRIELLLDNLTAQLDDIATGAELDSDASGRRDTVTVNLTGNHLSCLCNATGFIRWLKQSNVRFVDFDTYVCQHPNGSKVC